MIVTLTARRLKPGSQDDFRAAFASGMDDVPEEILKRWTRVYVSRDVSDENVILSFGLFDGTLEELREIQAQGDRDQELAKAAPHIEEVLLDGSYEVLEEITP